MGSVYLEERRREFINLRQKQLTVAEYEKEFIRLSRYEREIVSNEAERCRRFKEGINDNIKIMITTLGIMDFIKLIEVALKVERVKVSEQNRKDRQCKREFGQGQSSILTDSKKLNGSGSQDQTLG